MVHRILFLILFAVCVQTNSSFAQDEERNKGKIIASPQQKKSPSSASFEQSPRVNLTGTIRGKMVDKETGEEMMEAYIQLEGTQIGTRTDLDGTFTINNVPVGTYTLVVSYVGYQKYSVTGVTVKSGEVTVVNGFMVSESVTTEAVVIEAKALKNNESSVLNLQKVSSVSLDGISLAQTSRNGDNNAASALSRVTGLTVENNRYVYVRGLGDRYNKTLVNGAEVPGLDPTRNAVQLDMFPSNLIDNIIVYKAFAPDLPGSFTGGLIDITTRDFPDKPTFAVNMSLGYNDQTSFNKNYLLYKRGGLDWFGMDVGSREEPADVRGGDRTLPQASVKYDGEKASDRLNDKVVKDFGSEMTPSVQPAFLDHSFSISGGNQIQVFGRPLGFIASMTYRRTYNYYENGTEAYYQATGSQARSLSEIYNFNDRRGTDGALFGALLTLSYKLASNHRLSLTYNHNHAGDASGRLQEGTLPGEGVYNVRQNRVIQYLDRSIDIAQLRGEHIFPTLRNSKIEWTSSLVFLVQSEPDLRFMTNEYELDSLGRKVNYSIQPSRYTRPSRFYRTMDEISHDHRLHLTIPIKLGRDDSKLKFGGAFTQKLRAPFREKWYWYEGAGLGRFNGDVDALFAQKNLGVNPQTGDWNIVLRDNSQPVNSYDGKESIAAAYGMGDIGITKLIRVVAGVRMESTQMRVVSKDELIKPAEISTIDVLPCFNVILRPTEKMNVRINYGRTVARPILREMASYSNFDFIGGYVVIGNNELKRTVIDNIDLKWEYFPSANEVVSFGAFYKNFANPIERAISPQTIGTQAVEIKFRNVDQAVSYGLEAEVRKRFVVGRKHNIQPGLNVSLINSSVDIPEGELKSIRVYNPEAKSVRHMFAQSPYIINASLGYVNDSIRFSAVVNYNIFGPRIMEVGSGGAPDVYEMPRHTLDLNLQYRIQKITFRLNLANMLNPKFRFTQTFKDTEYTFREFTMGRRIGFSVTYQF